jgi:uncharacterized membrane protein YjjB (DUF3815 family)
MLIPVELKPLLPFWDLGFFIFGVPFVLWLNNKTRNDWLCLGLGILYMILYEIVFGAGMEQWTFFWFGLIVGYVTDYWGVNAKKWKYHPWDPDFGFSYYVGFAWAMVTFHTISISKIVETRVEWFFLPGILFIVPMIIFEYKFGETRRDQYFLYLRAISTFFAFFFADALGLLFVAIFIGSYIEFAGVNWIKNWLYIDDMSYIFLSFGYSLIVLCASVIYSLLNQIPIDFLVWAFIFAGLFFYAIDIFWAQKRVKLDAQKAVIAADRYKEHYEKG